MKDQVDRLRARRIPAVAIHSGLALAIDIALDNCVYGDVKFLYVAPERLATEAFRLRVVRMNVSLLAVDEAHCISQWGSDFRPSYLRIAELREKLPGVPVLALTASATKPVAEDIMRHLKFAEPHILRSSFARPNLSYSVRRTDDKNGQLLRLVHNVPGSGIVSCAPARAPSRPPNSCGRRASRPRPTTADWGTLNGRCGRRSGSRARSA